MKRNRLFLPASFFILFIISSAARAGEYKAESPDKNLVLRVNVGENITYSLRAAEKTIISPSVISMDIENAGDICRNAVVKNAETLTVDKTIYPIAPVKRKETRNNYNELTLNFKNNFSLIFRIYNDGAAYRFKTELPGKIKILNEGINITAPGDCKIYFPEESSFQTHQERLYKHINISQAGPNKFCSIPAMLEVDENNKIVFTEADLFDYPGIYLTGSQPGKNSLSAIFPHYPLKTELKRDRDEIVTETADYIAVTNGTREFPWRVFAYADDDKKFLANDIVFRLAKDCAIENTSWIKPGKVAWDWWNANNIYGVDFKSGVNTETYKYYIDFASKHGIEYVILDEGWYKLGNLLDLNPDINMDELTKYAKEKNVGLILWAVWKTLDNQLEQALNRFVEWGIKGIKVDFMQREDQWMINYYERISKEAAKRHLLVDFHGAFKPTGLYKTYPNVLTSEGVKGLENNKWGKEASPGNNVTFPFMRMLAGPADYTPGAMLNATEKDFREVFDRPMSQGTRCHQLAMCVLYESPLQMLADSPSNYLKEEECLAFITGVPVTWDNTIPLDAKVSEYMLTAKQSGNSWFVAGMTNWKERDLTVDLSFLDKGDYKIEIFQDGINADRCAVDYKKVEKRVSSSDKLKIHLAPGGGWAAKITR